MPDVKAYAVGDATALAALAENTDLMTLLPAGEYNLTLDATATVTVPALTAGSIVQASPSIGDLLTVTGSNAPATGLAYQWQQSADGLTGWANITGATSATLDTSSGVTDDYYVRRGVEVTGVQSMVYTAAVQVAAVVVVASSVTVTFVSSGAQETDGATSTISGLTLGALAADEFYAVIATSRGFAGCTLDSMTLDGVSLDSRAVVNNGSNYTRIFTSAMNGAFSASSDAVITFGTADGRTARVGVYKVKGASSVIPFDTAFATSGNGIDGLDNMSVDLPEGAGVIHGGMSIVVPTTATSTGMGTTDFLIDTGLITSYGFSLSAAGPADPLFNGGVQTGALGSSDTAIMAVWS